MYGPCSDLLDMIKVSASPPRFTVRTRPPSGSLAPKTVRRARNAGLRHHLLVTARPCAPREPHDASVSHSLHLPNERITKVYLCALFDSETSKARHRMLRRSLEVFMLLVEIEGTSSSRFVVYTKLRILY